ncbi:chorismate mutase [Sediminibacillus massiliensis]|uniref:chorismate mutase n=1 Tax=Sediminibacillus massiliensis TaxID=1926277 RepID=UPI0009884509|nr:chorismate mutase [Sediminibacillus massiliensis]
MIRGVRGATTVEENEGQQIIENTKKLIEEMADANGIMPDDIATVLVSMTTDLDAVFPAKALRKLEGWTYVPVMCMQEIEVRGSLKQCIRVMMTVNTDKTQEQINHVYHHKAKQLRPDLLK